MAIRTRNRPEAAGDARTVRPGQPVTYHNAPETGPAHDAVLVKKRERVRPATVVLELTVDEVTLLDAILSSHQDACGENIADAVAPTGIIASHVAAAARDLALVKAIRSELAAVRAARLAGTFRNRVFPRGRRP